MPKRCALGCPPLGVPTHTFPHPEKFPETFKAWVEIVGGKLETPDDYVFYRHKQICDIHFTEKDKNRNHRLNALAVPTLCLPDKVVKIIPASHLEDGHQHPPLTYIENLTDCPVNIAATPNVTQSSIIMENPTGSLHRFPVYKYPDKTEKFEQWKSVLDSVTQEKGNEYIFNNVRLCYRHFEEHFVFPSNQLTKNAIPTLNLESQNTPLHRFAHLHKFPNPDKDPDRFRTWMYSVGGDIMSMKNDDIFNCRRVCHLHFETKFHTRSLRLSRNAVPTLRLSGNAEPSVRQVREAIPKKYLPQAFKQKIQTQQEDEEEHDIDDAIDVSEEVPDTIEVSEEVVPDTIEVSEVAVPQTEAEGMFSWQKPSAVVPCDADIIEDEDQPQQLNTKKYPLHPGYHCNICELQIEGPRYVCVECFDWDLCQRCEARGAHPLHYVLRVPATRAHDEVQATLQFIRRSLLSNSIIHLDSDGTIKIKEEELEDPICLNLPSVGEPATPTKDSGARVVTPAPSETEDTEPEDHSSQEGDSDLSEAETEWLFSDEGDDDDDVTATTATPEPEPDTTAPQPDTPEPQPVTLAPQPVTLAPQPVKRSHPVDQANVESEGDLSPRRVPSPIYRPPVKKSGAVVRADMRVGRAAPPPAPSTSRPGTRMKEGSQSSLVKKSIVPTQVTPLQPRTVLVTRKELNIPIDVNKPFRAPGLAKKTVVMPIKSLPDNVIHKFKVVPVSSSKTKTSKKARPPITAPSITAPTASASAPAPAPALPARTPMVVMERLTLEEVAALRR